MRKFIILGFICLSVRLYAQDTVYINPGQHLLDEMIVSGHRWEQNPSEVAGKMSKIKTTEIQFHNPQTAADLLTLSPGVFMQKSQMGGGSPMIRGFATNRVLIVVDGVRFNNAIFRSGNVQNVISLDPNVIQQAEVLFGPGSVIYGSDAIGGVMDFHTFTPVVAAGNKTELKVNGMTRYSSANHERTAHADIKIGLRKLALLSSITVSDFDDLKMGKHGPEEYKQHDLVARIGNTDLLVDNDDPRLQQPTGYSQLNTMQKLRFQPKEFLILDYAFHYSKTSSYGRYDRLILRSQDGGLANAQWYYGPQQWLMNNINLHWKKRNVMLDELKLVVAYQTFKESRHNRSFGSSYLNNRFEEVDAISVNIDSEKRLGERAQLFYGVEYITNKISSDAFREDIISSDRSGIPTRYPDGATWRTYAAYASSKYRVSDLLMLNGSMRFTNVTSEARIERKFFNLPIDAFRIENNAVNGSLGMVLITPKNTKFYINASTGFRAPNIDDMGKIFDSQPGYVVVPNQSIKPEMAYNGEAGVASSSGRSLRIDLTAYYTLLDNAIVRGNYKLDGKEYIEYDGVLSRVAALQNIATVHIAGLQLLTEVRISKDLFWTSTFNYQRGKENNPDTGENLSPSHVAPIFGNSFLKYSQKRFKAQVYILYNGSVSYQRMPASERNDSHLYLANSDGNPYSPSWLTLNVKGSYEITKHISADLGIENVLDKRYRPYSSGISAPGRNVILTLRGRY